MRKTIILPSTLMLLACALAWAQAPAPTPPAATPPEAAAPAPALEGPGEIVQTAAQNLLTELDKDRAAYRRDPAKVSKLVDEYLLPHFDTEFSARIVLGPYWRTATPEQRQHFIDALYHSLLTNYGSALVEATADRLKIYPTKVDPPDAPRATVRTEVTRSNGDRVAVNYYLHRTPQGWKAWDVVIDGISYVNSYREDLQPQIEKQGLDAVTKRLESGAKPEAIGKQTSG